MLRGVDAKRRTDSNADTLHMTTASNANAPASSPRGLLKSLQATYAVFRDHAPLAIGIDKQLLARQPELDKKLLRVALSMHTNSLRYLKTLEKASQRLDLDGQPTAELTEEHRQHAAEQLRERFRKEAERRKAERIAEAAREAERRETDRRAAKLNQLVEKFARK